MKVLSLLQPWASLVVLGHKKIETRSWNTKHRGSLLIHASANKKGLNLIDKQDPFGEVATELLKLNMQYYDFPLGAIIGQAELITTFPSEVTASPNAEGLYFGAHGARFTKQELAFGDYSPGRYLWLLANAEPFQYIIPMNGSLSLWEYDLPENIGYNLPGGGHASFDGMPDQKTVEAVEEMVKAAKQIKFPL